MTDRVLILTVLLASPWAAARADTTSASWHGDGDGAIYCQSTSWNSTGQNGPSLTMTGGQYWAPGHLLGSLTTGSTDDPTLLLGSTMQNDTGLAWAGYQVNVYMSTAFSLPVSGIGIDAPTGWSVGWVQAPTFNGSEYEASIFFTGSGVVAPGDDIDFWYKLAFSGSTAYSFTQEMIPEYSAVPEPRAFGWAAALTAGGLALSCRLPMARRAKAAGINH